MTSNQAVNNKSQSKNLNKSIPFELNEDINSDSIGDSNDKISYVWNASQKLKQN